MAIKDLEGKRTGRRLGSKSRPPWERDLRWAYKNIGKPDAEPPSEFARGLRELGREHPDKLFDLLRAGPTANGTQDNDDSTPIEPQRVRGIAIDSRHLLARLTKDGIALLANLPRDAYIVGCQEGPADDEIVLHIHSDTFPPTKPGAAIPKIALEYISSALPAPPKRS
jgi:hypothetical protein